MNELTQKNAELGRFLFCERYTLQPVKNSLYIAEGQDLKRGAVVDVNGVLVGTNSLMPYAVLETDCDTRAKGAFASVFVKGEFNIDKLFFADGLSKNDLDNIVYNGSGTGLVFKPYNYAEGFSQFSNIAPNYTKTTYPVNSYVMHGGILYTNPYAIETAESWNPAHWVQTTIANMIAFIPNKTALIGGRTYKTVQIGDSIWLAENLDFKFSGCEIGAEGVLETPAAWYYNNNEASYGVNGNKYGLLYNWHAVKFLNDNRTTLCPGWHVATTTEWDALANAVGGSSVAGTKLKSTTGWSSGNGDDSYGFAAFPAGCRYSGSFNLVGSRAYFWTATERLSSFAYSRYFDTGASMYSDYYDKTNFAFSVRLVKDS